MHEADTVIPLTDDQSRGSAGSRRFTLPQFGIFAQGRMPTISSSSI